MLLLPVTLIDKLMLFAYALKGRSNLCFLVLIAYLPSRIISDLHNIVWQSLSTGCFLYIFRVKTLTYVDLQVIFDCKNGKKQELLLFKMLCETPVTSWQELYSGDYTRDSIQ